MKKSLKFKKKFCNVGFTLVELVIVIAIVVILSVVSVPIYHGYVDKAKWTEGYALLGMILSAQKAYFSEYGNFLEYENTAGHTCKEDVLGIDARGNKYFTWFRVGNVGAHEPSSRLYASVLIPKDLQEADDEKNGKNYLRLYYNVASGPAYDRFNY